jgi:hypothetical protein
MKTIRWFYLLLSFIPIFASAQQAEGKLSLFSTGLFAGPIYFNRNFIFYDGVNDSLRQSIKNRYVSGSGWIVGIPITFSSQNNSYFSMGLGLYFTYSKDETKRMADSVFDKYNFLRIDYSHLEYKSYDLSIPLIFNYGIALGNKLSIGPSAGISFSLTVSEVNTHYTDPPNSGSYSFGKVGVGTLQWYALLKLVSTLKINEQFFATLEPYYFLPLEGQKEENSYFKYRTTIRGVGLSINYRVKKKSNTK